jgi:hypothetical protein
MPIKSCLRAIGTAALAAGLSLSTAGLSAYPARADDHDRDAHHERGHQERAPEHRPYRHAYGYDEPRTVYAPPPVYYAPPPGPPIIDFVIPLNFR